MAATVHCMTMAVVGLAIGCANWGGWRSIAGFALVHVHVFITLPPSTVYDAISAATHVAAKLKDSIKYTIIIIIKMSIENGLGIILQNARRLHILVRHSCTQFEMQ